MQVIGVADDDDFLGDSSRRETSERRSTSEREGEVHGTLASASSGVDPSVRVEHGLRRSEQPRSSRPSAMLRTLTGLERSGVKSARRRSKTHAAEPSGVELATAAQQGAQPGAQEADGSIRATAQSEDDVGPGAAGASAHREDRRPQLTLTVAPDERARFIAALRDNRKFVEAGLTSFDVRRANVLDEGDKRRLLEHIAVLFGSHAEPDEDPIEVGVSVFNYQTQKAIIRALAAVSWHVV